MKCPNCEEYDNCKLAWKDEKDLAFCTDYKQKQTNEEWFINLPTKEKAKWLYDHYVNARADEYYGRQEKTLYEYQKWLVDVHKGIDGTKID